MVGGFALGFLERSYGLDRTHRPRVRWLGAVSLLQRGKKRKLVRLRIPSRCRLTASGYYRWGRPKGPITRTADGDERRSSLPDNELLDKARRSPITTDARGSTDRGRALLRLSMFRQEVTRPSGSPGRSHDRPSEEGLSGRRLKWQGAGSKGSAGSTFIAQPSVETPFSLVIGFCAGSE